MTIVHFSRAEFEKHIKITSEIEEKMNLFGTHVESITHDEVALEILPNRPDMFSLQGFLRAFKAFLGKETGLKNYNVKKPQKDFEVKVDSSVSNVRPFTACAIVKNISFNDARIKEIIDVQEKIHFTIGRNRKKVAIGIYPLEKISLPITYVAKKPEEIRFVPLGFDYEMSGKEILERHPTGIEYGHLLKDKEMFPVFIDAKGDILSMPPIINSEKTGKVTEATRDVFIECSGFDLELLKKTLNILVTMLADMGGTIYQMKIKYSKGKIGKSKDKVIITPDLTPEKFLINAEAVNKLLGLNLSLQEIKKCAERMGHLCKVKNKMLIVYVPAWRTDVMHENDLIEDIAIAYGYNNFKPELPMIATIGKESRTEIIKRKIAEMLIGLNLLELSSYHLITKEDLKKSGEKNAIEVEKSKTEYCLLRPNLLCNLLKIFGKNVDAEYPQRVFEIGKVFKLNKENKEDGILESEHLAIGLCPGNFTEIKQILDYIGRMLNLNFEIEYTQNRLFIDGRVGKIILNKNEIGILGEVHPATLKEWHIRLPLVLLEINLEPIFSIF